MSVGFKWIHAQILHSEGTGDTMKNNRSMVNLRNVTVVHLNVDSGYLTYLSKSESRDKPVVKGITLTR